MGWLFGYFKTVNLFANHIILLHVADAPRGSPDLIVDNPQPEEGESVILKCTTSNIDSYFPLISYNWAKDGVPHTEWANDTIVNIAKVKHTDSANYSCSAGNFIGYSTLSSPIYLDVLCKYLLYMFIRYIGFSSE